MNYDTLLFVEIIESVSGVKFIREENSDGISVKFYEGLTGRLVIIDTTDDELTDDTGKGYLSQLGLAYLIPAIFPDIKEEVPSK